MMNRETVVLRASWGGPIALFLVSALAAVCAYLAFRAARGMDSHAPAMIVGGIAVVFAVLGAGLAARSLTISSDGLEASSWFGKRAIGWSEVDHYTFWAMDRGNQAAAQAAGGLLGVLIYYLVTRNSRRATANRRFSYGQLKIRSSSGTAIVIDARYRDVASALDDVFDELHQRLRARPERDYRPFALSASGVQNAKGDELGLAEIEHVAVSGGRLAFKKRGKRLAWAASAMRRVRNSVLLLEDLGQRGVKVTANAAMFLPAPTLETVNAAAARQAAMPAARVVRR
jgi:hypothetical protein